MSYLDSTGLSYFWTKIKNYIASASTTGNAGSATKDASGNVITETYETKANAITGLSVSGKVITYTKGSGTTGTITTQDTNTDTLMTQTASTTNTTYPLLLSSSTVTGTRTGLFSTNATLNPSTGTIATNYFVGTLTGNATTATTLATARTIGLSGVTATSQSFNGSANITIPVTAIPATLLTGTASISTTGNAATSTKATQDGSGNDIVSTYAKLTDVTKYVSDVAVSGSVLTVTKGDATTASTPIMSGITRGNVTIDSASAGSSTVTLPITVTDVSRLLVFQNSALLLPDMDYTVSTTALTLASYTTIAGDVFSFVYFN